MLNRGKMLILRAQCFLLHEYSKITLLVYQVYCGKYFTHRICCVEIMQIRFSFGLISVHSSCYTCARAIVVVIYGTFVLDTYDLLKVRVIIKVDEFLSLTVSVGSAEAIHSLV